MSSQPPLPFSFDDRYRVDRLVGTGGTAFVYLAHDVKHDRAVALKVLRPDVSANLGPERFLREIQIAARLNHPNILALLDSGEADGLLYYVMPFVDGESLRERLNRERQLPIDTAMHITRHVGAALDYAHRSGVVHRDIKPENILLYESAALVADFGIAVALQVAVGDRLTKSGVVIGTPRYMSPEQAVGDSDIDARTDVFSLACVLFEMLTGEPPHSASSAQAVIAKLLADPPPSARRLRNTIPRSVDAALRRGLATAPADRFQSVKSFVDSLSTPSEPAPTLCCVAVLPFANMSADPENEYFADGITEDIIAQLSKIGALKVISRTSVMQFRDRRTTVAEVGTLLGVSAVIEGSVRRAGGRVRIVAQLIDVATDEHLWAETYDRELTDVFAIQSDVALSVAQALQASLTTAERRRIRGAPTRSIEAYDLYLLGRHHWFHFTADGARKAGEYFREALALDPSYAPAYAGLADYYLMIGGAPLNLLPGAQTVPEAKRNAERAIQLDPTIGDAYEALALTQCWFDWNWSAARETVLRGTELAPNSSLLWSAYAHVYDIAGLYDEAVPAVVRALQLDPLSGLGLQNAAWVHIHARSYREAQTYLDRLFELHPGYPIGVFTQAELLLAQGRDAEAAALIEPVSDVMQAFDYGMAILAMALGRTGQTNRALDLATRLALQCREGRAAWPDVALAYLGVGDVSRALDCIELAPDQRPPGGMSTAYLGVSPLFDAIRDHPRFRTVVEAIPSRAPAVTAVGRS